MLNSIPISQINRDQAHLAEAAETIENFNFELD
jgi:hypothetical protein